MKNKEVSLLSNLGKGFKMAVKSWADGEPFASGGITTQSFWQHLTGSHSFNRKGLQWLVETGYANNPVGFGIVTKILLAQGNIGFVPYRYGKPFKSGAIDLDLNFGLQMFCTTGNVFIWKKEVVGFSTRTLEVINTLKLTENYNYRTRKFTYTYEISPNNYIVIPYEDFIHIKFRDISNDKCTNMGLSPFQAAIMPLEALKEMYIADTSLLKNKGVEVLISNGSENVLLENEVGENDRALNARIMGARKSGGVATSNAKLDVHQIGRTIKELALWDGYKIKKRDLCDVLQVDSGLFNDPDNKTYANRTEAEKSLYTSCVIPFTRLITGNKELSSALGFEIFLDTSNIECLQTSQGQRFEKNNTITNAIITLNQKVKDMVITRDIAISILVNEWQYDQEEAAAVIGVQIAA